MNYMLKRVIFECFIFIVMTTLLSGCKIIPTETPSADINTTAEAVDESAISSTKEPLIPADFSNYVSITNMFREIVEICSDFDYKNGESSINDTLFDIPGEEERRWFEAIVYEVNCYMPFASYYNCVYPKELFGYAQKDLDGNGNDELILLLNDYTILAIFSLYNGKPILLDSFDARHVCSIDSEGALYVYSSGGAAYTSYRKYTISTDGGQLVLVEEFGVDGWNFESGESIYYKMSEGEKQVIDKAEFTELRDAFRNDYGTDGYSGLMYIPL